MNTLEDLDQTKSVFKGANPDGSPNIVEERYLFVNSNMGGFLGFDLDGILDIARGFNPSGVLSLLDTVNSFKNRVAVTFLHNDIAFYSANNMSLFFDFPGDLQDDDIDTIDYLVTYRNDDGTASNEQEYFDNRDLNTLAGPIPMPISTTGVDTLYSLEAKVLSLISDIAIPSKSEVNFTTNPLNQTLQKNISFSTESVLGTQLDESGFSVTITEGTEIETPAPTTSTTDLTTSTGTGTASPSAGTAISGYGGRSAAVGSSGGGGSYS